MPNHISNCLHAPKYIVDSLKSEDRLVDFNNVIRMPDSLRMEGVYHTVSDEIMRLVDNMIYVPDDIDNIIQNYPIQFLETSSEVWHSWNNSMKAEAVIQLQNYYNYGYTSWYDWSIDNWGTKWNAYDIEEKPYGVYFETAWSMPMPVYKRLSSRFPSDYFCVRWASEDVGYYNGIVIFQYGRVVAGGEFTSASKQAYHNYIETCHDGIMPDYMFWNNGKLEYKDE